MQPHPCSPINTSESLGTTVVTAGLIGGDTDIQGFTQHLMVNAVRSVVKASVSAVADHAPFFSADQALVSVICGHQAN